MNQIEKKYDYKIENLNKDLECLHFKESNILNEIKSLKEKIFQNELIERVEEVQLFNFNSTEVNNCLFCNKNICNFLCLPCKHLILCEECNDILEKIKFKNCLLCHEFYEEKLFVIRDKI